MFRNEMVDHFPEFLKDNTSQIKKQEVLPGLVGTENRKRHVWEPRQLILDVLCPLEPKNYELPLPCLFHPHFFFLSTDQLSLLISFPFAPLGLHVLRARCLCQGIRDE